MDPQRHTPARRFGPGRRSFIGLAAGGAVLGAVPVLSARASGSGSSEPSGGGPEADPAAVTYRPVYHHTVPDEWKNDPQRPLLIDGTYHYYYLYNADYSTDGEGTAWRRTTSTDLVTFADQGVAIPKDTTPAGDVWSGCAVLDPDDTAGFGAGAVVALVTMEPVEGADTQAQYLWYSTDGGRSFVSYGDDPVLPNPGVRDFRDPKLIWDAERGRWVQLLTENNKVGFYVSPDLKNWTYVSGFVRDGIGVLECPDIFRIETGDGEARWVLGVSANGKEAGLPNTYAYWVGAFDGESFTPEAEEPRWLDHGFDWYGAVTWEKYTDLTTGAPDPTTRYAIGWMNNWDYPHNTPTLESDGFNGTDSIVREVTLGRDEDGEFALFSRPVDTLADHVARTIDLGDQTVDGELVLDYTGVAYELSTQVRWEQLTTLGIQLRRSADGSGHVDVGVHEDYAFLNRGGVPNPDTGGSWQESRTPFDPGRREVTLRILVDRTTVEVFLDDGRHVHSQLAYPAPEDAGLALFTVGGPATFGAMVIHEFD
ncbi:glycoside hydrolase family 32 protein [Streptomyces sp. NBRC 109706]|uniref:glycoside hydrolase family 32 protein n=1 Tax=Streptomyces sp. NBRC 109706 TaxID=1550035 RepID=UPI00099C9FCB|nr:glycoside hydrolase family 32 protein [Streptomyces sp. NBRC 109706]